MSVQATTMSPVMGFDMFLKNRRLKKVLALTLVASVIFVACCAFTTIAMVSSILGIANSMGLFGDGELSKYIGYASIAGSVVGMAGNMMWPGGGIGSGYGSDGFGMGYSTETYQAAATVAGIDDPSYLENMSTGDRLDMDKAIADNRTAVDKQMIIDEKNAAANAANKQSTVTADADKKLTSMEQVQQNHKDYSAANTTTETANTKAETVVDKQSTVTTGADKKVTSLEQVQQNHKDYQTANVADKTSTNTTVTKNTAGTTNTSYSVTNNQQLALNQGFGPVNEEYANQLAASGQLKGSNSSLTMGYTSFLYPH